MNMKNIRLVCIFIGVAFLLLIPLAAGFPWSAMDFVVAGVLLLGTGLVCEVALRIVKTTWVKVAAVAAILFGLVMVWGTLVHLGG
jgi:hypothetical protein